MKRLFSAIALSGPMAVDPQQLIDEIMGAGNKLERIEVPTDELAAATRAKKMAEFGFTQTPQAIKAVKYDKIVAAVDEIMENRTKYAAQYPDYPFLTTTQMEEIAEKYSLVCGRPRDFIADIPAKNQSDVIEFNNMAATDRIIKGTWVMAPAAMFDLLDKEIEGVYVIDKDPIIFAEVPGGVLYVTHWGDDAIEPMKEIDAIVNENAQYITQALSASGDITVKWFGGTAFDMTDIVTTNATISDTVWFDLLE